MVATTARKSTWRFATLAALASLAPSLSLLQEHCEDGFCDELDDASMLQFKVAQGTVPGAANPAILAEVAPKLRRVELGRLGLAPVLVGCFPRSSTDLQDTLQFMDKTCATASTGPCRSGLPFYRLPLQAQQTYLDCYTFCLSKGLDLSGLAGTAAPSSGVECRCGATEENLGAWRRQTPPQHLLLPMSSKLESTSSSDCAVMVWKYAGALVDSEVPQDLQASSDADIHYLNDVIGLSADLTAATARSFEQPTAAPTANSSTSSVLTNLGLLVDGPEHDRAVSLIATRGLCQDATNTGFATATGTPLSCGSLKSYCSTMPSVKAACPLTCGVCSSAGSWLPCYPNSCGPGGGPWPTKAADGLVYISYWFDTNVDDTRKATFRAAAADWAASTCIRFVENSVKPRLLVGIYDTSSCYSIVGYPGNGGEGKMNMGWCSTMSSKGSIVHELGHAIGMNHEQTRPDAASQITTPDGARGPYLRIYWGNIDSSWTDQYLPDARSYIGSGRQSTQDPWVGYAPYSYDSIMHYGRSGGTKPNFDTVNTIFNSVVGQRTSLAAGDIRQVNDMYQCTTSSSTAAPTTTTTTTRRPTTTTALAASGTWTPGPWGPCTRRTGQTACTMSRSLQCLSSSGAALPVTSCSATAAPATTQSCSCLACADVSVTRFVLGSKPAVCKDLVSYCNDATYGAAVRSDCPDTCGLCSLSTCVDKSPTRFMLGSTPATCTQLQGYCSDATYGTEVRIDCPKTCNACGCRDKSPTRFQIAGTGAAASCTELKANGYCTSIEWKTEVELDCPVSCGVCKPDQFENENGILVEPPQRVQK